MSWKNPQQWAALKDGSGCPMCADMHLPQNEFSFLVSELEYSYVRLPRNQYASGWLVVPYKRHACELHEMSGAELAGYWQDVARAARALDKVYHPVKINYMIFGNLVPHVHTHLLPRFVDHDPSPQLFLDIDKHPTFLESEKYQELIGRLREGLKA